jgi:hypothetical protein
MLTLSTSQIRRCTTPCHNTWGNPLSAFKMKIDMEQAEKKCSSKVPKFCCRKLLRIGLSLYKALLLEPSGLGSEYGGINTPKQRR